MARFDLDNVHVNELCSLYIYIVVLVSYALSLLVCGARVRIVWILYVSISEDQKVSITAVVASYHTAELGTTAGVNVVGSGCTKCVVTRS